MASNREFDSSQTEDDLLIDEGDSGIERHPDMSTRAGVAPSEISDHTSFNALRMSLMPVACWRLDDHRFEFDSSFILPETRDDLARLATMHGDFKDSPMSIFGHADPVGGDSDYNKKLSGYRAKSTYALLTRKTEMWEELHDAHGWGLTSIQKILMFLDEVSPPEPPAEPYVGPADGKNTRAYREVVKRFQSTQGDLRANGVADKATRKRLYELYMDAICAHPSGEPFKVDSTAFLGQGIDRRGKAAFQGCSDFNAVLLLSKEELREFRATHDAEGRNAANAPNRRVVLYFFTPHLKIDIKKWPCPRADEGSARCQKRFWSDHAVRRKLDPEDRRSYKETRDTFACRFYDRFAFQSPCEAGFREWVIQLIKPGEGPAVGREPLAGVRFIARGNGRVTRGATDANGLLRIRRRDEHEVVNVELAIPAPQREQPEQPASSAGAATRTTQLSLTLSAGDLIELDDSTTLATIQRLRNLGYGSRDARSWTATPDTLEQALRAFQADHDLEQTGELNDATTAKLREAYGS